MNSNEDGMYLVMDDTFDEKAAEAEYEALSDEDKKRIKELLDQIR